MREVERISQIFNSCTFFPTTWKFTKLFVAIFGRLVFANICSFPETRFVILKITSVYSDLKQNLPVWVSFHKVVVRMLKGF